MTLEAAQGVALIFGIIHMLIHPFPSSSKRTNRPPKEMVPLEPAQFAAQLISRLESLKRKQDTFNCLEERLQQIQEVGVMQLVTGLPNFLP